MTAKNRMLLLTACFLSTLVGCGTGFDHEVASQSVQSMTSANKSRPFNEVTFLTAHNAYSSTKYATSPVGGAYHQQTTTVTEQLKFGVRAFMLDTHAFKQEVPPLPRRIALCHGDCSVLNFGDYKTVVGEIVDFLRKNPQEVVTIILEDYVREQATVESFEQIYLATGADQFIFKKSNPWNIMSTSTTKWPTLDWMIQQNKRLVIFQDSGPDRDVHLNYNDFLYQNLWSKVEGFEQCKMLNETHGSKTLYVFNHFPKSPMHQFSEINGRMLQESFQRCHHGSPAFDAFTLVPRYTVPNFIAVDHVQHGEASKLVAHLNQSAPGADFFRPHKYHCEHFPTTEGNKKECNGQEIWGRWGGKKKLRNQIGSKPVYCLDTRTGRSVHTDICASNLSQLFVANNFDQIAATEQDMFRCLEVAGDTNNSLVKTAICDSTKTSQKFKFEKDGIVHIASQKCLNVNNGTSGPDIPLVLNTCAFKDNAKTIRIDKQRFTMGD